MFNAQRELAIARSIARLSDRTAFYVILSVVMFFLASSSVPTPLYAIYQEQWGFSSSTVTIVFGVYAVAVLVSLLTVGSLSDYVGRKPILLTAVFSQAAIMLIFANAQDVTVLILARVLQGLTTGAALGALGAALLDLNRTKGTAANAVATPFGTAAGSLGSSLLVHYLPAPTHLVYLLLFAVFILQGAVLSFMAESSTPKAGALGSLKPQLGVPRTVRRPLAIGTPVLIAVWALAGFYGALGPSVVDKISHSTSIILGGLTMFVLAGVGSLTVLIIQKIKPRSVMFLGAFALMIGLGTTLLAVATNSVTEFFIGTAVSGIGFGGGFQGVLRTVIPQASAEDRANVISVIFVISYLSMGIPSIVAGFLVVHDGLLLTTQIFGAVIIGLASLAVIGLFRRSTSA